MSLGVSPLGAPRVVIMMPVRDDWQSAAELIRLLDKSLSRSTDAIEILIIDDGSVQPCNPREMVSDFKTVRSIQTLRLRRNVGHQRAIAIGLSYIQKMGACDAVV